jgi:hypothetical protein
MQDWLQIQMEIMETPQVDLDILLQVEEEEDQSLISLAPQMVDQVDQEEVDQELIIR